MNNSVNDSVSAEHKDVVKKKKHYSLWDQIVVTVLITLTYASINFEMYMPESFVEIYKGFLLLVFAGTWITLSFTGGYKKKYSFGIYAVLFWLIPQFIIYLAESGPEFFRMSIIMYALSELSALITSIPAGFINNMLGSVDVTGVFVIVLVCAFSFLSGMLVYETRKKR